VYKMAFYERITSLLPGFIKEPILKELSYMRLTVDEKRFIGFLFSFSLALSFAIALNLYLFLYVPFLPAFLILFFLSVGVVYAWIYFSVEAKAKYAEKVLPDALQAIASNLGAGFTLDKALYYSARKELGILAEEFKATSRKIAAGTPVHKALLDIPKHIKSEVIEKVIWLISEGIRTGGEISSILIELSADLRRRHTIKAETKANISIYALLILFAAAFAAPALMGISTFIVEVTAARTATFTLPENLPPNIANITFLGIPGKGLDPDFVINFSILVVIIGTFFASFTLGIINTGREVNGLKYLPILLIVAISVFILVRDLLRSFFAGLL